MHNIVACFQKSISRGKRATQKIQGWFFLRQIVAGSGCDPSDLVKIRHFLSKQTTTRHPDHWIYSINILYSTKSEPLFAQIIVSVIYLPIVVVMMASSLIRFNWSFIVTKDKNMTEISWLEFQFTWHFSKKTDNSKMPAFTYRDRVTKSFILIKVCVSLVFLL